MNETGSDPARCSGLTEGERVVLNPGTGIVEGELIQPVGAGGK